MFFNLFLLLYSKHNQGRCIVRQLLLQKFDNEEAKVQRTLNRPSVKRKMEKLRQKGLVTSRQWATLYPLLDDDKIDFKQVDLLLYILLLRKLGELPMVSGPGGFEQWPKETDQSTPAQIVRLKLLKEETESASSMEEPEFNSRWRTLERTLLGLKYSKYAIDNLKTCCVEQEKDLGYYWYHVWNSPELHRNELIAFCLLFLAVICVFDWWVYITDALESWLDNVMWNFFKLKKMVFG